MVAIVIETDVEVVLPTEVGERPVLCIPDGFLVTPAVLVHLAADAAKGAGKPAEWFVWFLDELLMDQLGTADVLMKFFQVQFVYQKREEIDRWDNGPDAGKRTPSQK